MNKKTIQMYFGSSLHEAWFSDTAISGGIGSMIVTRKTAGGAVVGVVFLCNHYCLGVKDCFAFMESEAGYRSIIEGIHDREDLKLVEAGYVKAYILGLVQWAKEVGFRPHADYRFCSEILRGFPANENAAFQFGKDGLPYYMNGPYDEPHRIRQIVATLNEYRERTGNEAYYTIGGPMLPDELLVPVREIEAP
jgi:hypothetical protein